MKVQTFPHDVVEELHDGDPAVGIVVQQLGINSSSEEFSEGGETNLFFSTKLLYSVCFIPAVNMFFHPHIIAGCLLKVSASSN